jgi:hypothetical protein
LRRASTPWHGFLFKRAQARTHHRPRTAPPTSQTIAPTGHNSLTSDPTPPLVPPGRTARTSSPPPAPQPLRRSSPLASPPSFTAILAADVAPTNTKPALDFSHGLRMNSTSASSGSSNGHGTPAHAPPSSFHTPLLWTEHPPPVNPPPATKDDSLNRLAVLVHVSQHHLHEGQLLNPSLPLLVMNFHHHPLFTAPKSHVDATTSHHWNVNGTAPLTRLLATVPLTLPPATTTHDLATAVLISAPRRTAAPRRKTASPTTPTMRPTPNHARPTRDLGRPRATTSTATITSLEA